jgi:predicted RNA-binding protein YlqC (UPF0109 family)
MKKKPAAAEKPKTTPDVELLKKVVNAFTRHHDALQIEIERDGVIVLQSCRDDHPRIVGAAGRNITAIRNIFQFIAARRKEKLTIILNEPTTGQRAALEPYQPDPAWKPDGVVELMTDILKRIVSSAFTVEAVSAKDTTLLQIRGSKDDDRILEILQPSLQTIFHAIGRAQGRALHVVIASNEAIEALS